MADKQLKNIIKSLETLNELSKIHMKSWESLLNNEALFIRQFTNTAIIKVTSYFSQQLFLIKLRHTFK